MKEYKKRYGGKLFQQRLKAANDKFKYWLLQKVSKSKWLVDRYRIYDHYSIKNNEERAFPWDQPRVAYKDLKLKHLHFFDVIEIDSINEQALRQFAILAKEKKKLRFADKEDPVEIYRSFKKDMNIISFGRLVSVDFRNNRKRSNDYLDFVSVSFIKTTESFVVIRVDVTPSNLFHDVLKEIIQAEVDSKGVVHYCSYSEILRRLRFVSHFAMGSNSLSRSLDNLFFDMQHQVMVNILCYLNGTLSKGRRLIEIPSLAYFQVSDIEGFHADKKLQKLFPRTFDGPFVSEDGKTEVYLSEMEKENRDNIRIIREVCDGHSDEEVNLHFMLDSFAFPCAFRAKLRLQITKLNLLKRDIYDFTEYIDRNKGNYLLSFFQANGRYIRLKIRLTKFITSMKRFESEFKSDEITVYLDEPNLSSFVATKPRKERETLLGLYRSEFNHRSDIYESSIKALQEIFKSIEELNSFRTNLVLQVFSVVVAIMAIVLAFDKVKSLFKTIGSSFMH